MQIFPSALLYLVSLSQYLHNICTFVLLDFASNLEREKRKKKEKKKRKEKKDVASGKCRFVACRRALPRKFADCVSMS